MINIEFFTIVAAGLVALFSAVLSIIWAKADKAEKTFESNKIFLSQMTRNLDKTAQLTERLTSLEAMVSVEIKNLSVSIKRMESAVLRANSNDRNRSH